MLSVTRFADEQEAVALANDTSYGLGKLRLDEDVDKALRMARALRSGLVWVNTTMDGGPQLPFGGVKGFGYGREMGRAGLEQYTELRDGHCAGRGDAVAAE